MLANPGEEYLILQPSESAEPSLRSTAQPFTVELAAGSYTVEWYSLNSWETAGAGVVLLENPSPVRFSSPFEVTEPAVLYLKKWESDKKE